MQTLRSLLICGSHYIKQRIRVSSFTMAKKRIIMKAISSFRLIVSRIQNFNVGRHFVTATLNPAGKNSRRLQCKTDWGVGKSPVQAGQRRCFGTCRGDWQSPVCACKCRATALLSPSTERYARCASPQAPHAERILERDP